MADDTDSFPSSSIPKFRVGQLVRFYDRYYKRHVTGIVTFCERPLGYYVYTVTSRIDGRHHTLYTYNLQSLNGKPDGRQREIIKQLHTFTCISFGNKHIQAREQPRVACTHLRGWGGGALNRGSDKRCRFFQIFTSALKAYITIKSILTGWGGTQYKMYIRGGRGFKQGRGVIYFFCRFCLYWVMNSSNSFYKGYTKIKSIMGLWQRVLGRC